jgi:hypothetical protein
MNAGTQNWSIVQTPDDWMYFANNKGLLEFNGMHWNIYQVTNKSEVRSIYYDKDSNYIFTGAFKEFGYFSRDKIGTLKYKSISNLLINKKMNFSEIWGVNKYEKKYFFQSDKTIFCYDFKKFNQYIFDEKINYSTVVANYFFISLSNSGLFYFKNNRFISFPVSKLFKQKKIVSIQPLPDKRILFVTDFNGLFVFDGKKITPYSTDIDKLLSQNQIFCATIKNNLLALGTVQNGLIVKNLSDNSTIFSNISSGMQNNTILSISFDRLNNIWLGLDNGIDYVLTNSSIYNLFGDSNAVGAGYTSAIYNSKLHLGTNMGLFTLSYPLKSSQMKTKPEVISSIKGQIWDLSTIDNTLFCSSDRGLYEIKKSYVRRIGDVSGVWCVKPFNNNPNILLGANYNRFFVISKKNGSWEFSHFIKGHDITAGNFIQDSDSNLWYCHSTDGVYRLKLNKELNRFEKTELFTTKDNLPTNNNIRSFIYNNVILFSTVNGLYHFNKIKNRFEKSKKPQIPTRNENHKVYVSPDGNIWSIYESRIDVAMNKKNMKYEIDSVNYIYFNDKIIQNFGYIGFLSDKKLMFGTQDGFSLVEAKNQIKTDEKQNLRLINITLTKTKDSLLTSYINNQDNLTIPVLDFKHNSIRFEYISTEYRSANTLYYSYILDGNDTKWSDWTRQNTKEYTDLKMGNYVFKVRAKNLLNSKIIETKYQFKVLPPWYKSKLAQIIYLILIALIIYLLLQYIQSRTRQAARKMEIKKEAEIKEQQKQFEIEAKEKEREIISLKNQQLEYELRHKSQDLASSTMNVIRKNEFLLSLSKNIDKINDEIFEIKDLSKANKRIKHLQIEINQNIEIDNNWTKFQENFDMVYENYLKRLGEKYPILTNNDKRICAYIRMGLSSKDIAPLTNTTFQSVEMNRHRLRKKLNLEREINLSEFLQNF